MGLLRWRPAKAPNASQEADGAGLSQESDSAGLTTGRLTRQGVPSTACKTVLDSVSLTNTMCLYALATELVCNFWLHAVPTNKLLEHLDIRNADI